MPFRLKSWPHIVFPPPIVFPLPIVFPCVVIKVFVAFSAAFRPGFMPRWICVARRGVWRGGRHQLHRHHRGVYLAPFLPGLSYGPNRSVSVRYRRIARAVAMPTWGFGLGLRYRGSAISPRLANRRTPISFLSLCYSLLPVYSSTHSISCTDFLFPIICFPIAVPPWGRK